MEDGCELWPIVNIVTSGDCLLTSLHYTPQQGEWDLEDQWGPEVGEFVTHCITHYVTIDEINGDYLLYLPSMYAYTPCGMRNKWATFL